MQSTFRHRVQMREKCTLKQSINTCRTCRGQNAIGSHFDARRKWGLYTHVTTRMTLDSAAKKWQHWAKSLSLHGDLASWFSSSSSCALEITREAGIRRLKSRQYTAKPNPIWRQRSSNWKRSATSLTQIKHRNCWLGQIVSLWVCQQSSRETLWCRIFSLSL